MLDTLLTQPARLVIIGGTAVALGWNPRHTTSDIDLLGNPGPEFWQAVDACRAQFGTFQITPVGVASCPYNFEDRLIRLTVEGLRHLIIEIPEAHDLALMKTARGEAHDLDAIEDIHRHEPLSLTTLIERYHETKDDIRGPLTRFQGAFLALVERLFGPAAAEEVAPQIGYEID